MNNTYKLKQHEDNHYYLYFNDEVVFCSENPGTAFPVTDKYSGKIAMQIRKDPCGTMCPKFEIKDSDATEMVELFCCSRKIYVEIEDKKEKKNNLKIK